MAFGGFLFATQQLQKRWVKKFRQKKSNIENVMVGLLKGFMSLKPPPMVTFFSGTVLTQGV
jgi:hypothetical protein